MSANAVQPDTTRNVARWVTGLSYADLPADVVAAAKRQVLDTLAVAWAGTGADGIDNVRQVIDSCGGTAQSHVWCLGESLPATQAAFINAMLASALDFDSLHDRANVHSDGVVLPAIFALADARGANGEEVITALVAGGELVVRLGLAAGSSPGWFYSSVFGVFGAAAAAAKLLRLDETQTLNALGIALSQASGTRQPLFERSLTKRLQAAYAARSGVEAALMAEAGVTGPSQALEGSSGIHGLYVRLDKSLLDGLGTQYHSSSMTFKKFASCMCNHAPIEACLQLAAQTGISSGDIEAITVTVSPYMNQLTGLPFEPGASPQVSAQFNVRYSVASTLMRGRFDVMDIQPAAVLDPQVRALASRVSVVVNESGGQFGPARIQVFTKSGAVHSQLVEAPPGTPELPLSDQELIAKALTCFANAAVPMPSARARALIETIHSLELLPNAASLLH
ncbi:MAG TPA: MmgE/PrpD family protein [Ramlibacter sp.]|nr:MmgE/PrpD family protein [Ramlibacter sp.]